jgi:phosphatidylglycerophosphate synthase|mmetsp:Transcript_49229/g.77851  ORF Transcript_49229/g.77851 Transcript_49229/m.77851 type:complete len:417 (-) Transcript_49229:84-1334(-)
MAEKRTASPAAPAKRREMTEEDRKNALNAIKANRLVIPESGLKAIAEHKYKAGVYTPFDNLFNKVFWTPLSGHIPSNIAPNTITITGLAIKVLGYATLAWYCTDFKSVAPQWAYIFCAATVFLYQTFDALDGKQARRTGSSSPLGQLFDHGCDSVATVFISMIIVMCLQLGFTARGVMFIMSCLLPFWLAQWNEYHVHVLHTSILGLYGVTEMQLSCMGLILANVFKPGIFTTPLKIGSMPSLWCGNETCPIAANDCIVLAHTIIAWLGAGWVMYGVAKVTRSRGTMRLAVSQLMPVVMLAVVGLAWCIFVPNAHPRLVFFTIGLQFSHMTCKIIVAGMSRTEFKVWQPALLPLPIILVIALLKLMPRHDDVLLGAYTALSTYMFISWVWKCIEEISRYMGIHTFRIKSREKPKAL